MRKVDVRGSEGLGDRMVGEESDLFSFGKLRKGCFSLNDLRHNMDISRLPNSTEKDYVRLERYQEEYEMLMEMLREVSWTGKS